MNWQEYKEWLEENILEKQEISEEDNYENETSPYTLCPEAKTKYAVNNEKELITALTNLITSINSEPSYSYSDQTENDYHSLPALNHLINEKNQAITWNQLFPSRTEAFFGAKDNNQPLDQTIFTILGKIFNDWIQTTTRAERLKAMLDENQVMGKFLIEMAVSLNYDLIKRKGYDTQLKNWIKEYEQLDSEDKNHLAKQKFMVEQILTTLAEESASRSRSNENIPPANSAWNWKEISKWGLIGLVILLGLGLLLRLIKGGKN